MRRLNDRLEQLPFGVQRAILFGGFIIGFGSAVVFLYWLAGKVAE